MRKSRIPNPPTAEDILGARLNSLRKKVDGMAVVEFSETPGTSSPDAGGAYFIGYSVVHQVVNVAAAAIEVTDNDLKLGLFFLPFNITVVAINFETVATFAGQFIGIGLYDIDSILVLDSGPIDVFPAGVVRQVIADTDVPAGAYWLGVTAKANGSAIPTVRVPVAVGNGLNTLNSGVVRYGKIAAQGVNGQLPLTFDPTAIVSEGSALPYILFEAAPA